VIDNHLYQSGLAVSEEVKDKVKDVPLYTCIRIRGVKIIIVQILHNHIVLPFPFLSVSFP